MSITMEEIGRLIEGYAAIAADAGFAAGALAAAQPWQPIAMAPRDGTSVILGVGATRCVGYFSLKRGCWLQQGTGRQILPSIWMVLPPIPKVHDET